MIMTNDISLVININVFRMNEKYCFLVVPD